MSEAPSIPSQSFVTPFLNQKQMTTFCVYGGETSEEYFFLS